MMSTREIDGRAHLWAVSCRQECWRHVQRHTSLADTDPARFSQHHSAVLPHTCEERGRNSVTNGRGVPPVHKPLEPMWEPKKCEAYVHNVFVHQRQMRRTKCENKGCTSTHLRPNQASMARKGCRRSSPSFVCQRCDSHVAPAPKDVQTLVLHTTASLLMKFRQQDEVIHKLLLTTRRSEHQGRNVRRSQPSP